MDANTIAQVANQATGLFIGVFTADQYNATHGAFGADVEAGYVVRDNRDGLEEVATRAEAFAIAAEWATDAKDDAPAEDIAALDAFLAQVTA